MQVPAELRIKYLSRRIEDIKHLRHLLENDDYSLALKLGHQVKGNAHTFEFPQMASLGVEIEMAAKNRNKEAVSSLADKMEYALQHARSLFTSSYPLA